MTCSTARPLVNDELIEELKHVDDDLIAADVAVGDQRAASGRRPTPE